MSIPVIPISSLVKATFKPAIFGLITGFVAEALVKKTTQCAADFFIERMKEETKKHSAINPAQKKVIKEMSEKSGREIRNVIFVTSGVATLFAATISSVFIYDRLSVKIRL